MKKKNHTLYLVLFVFLAAALIIPVVSLAGSYAECAKDCQQEYQECVDICKKHLKDPNARAKCKNEGCKIIVDDCLKDCKGGG